MAIHDTHNALTPTVRRQGGPDANLDGDSSWSLVQYCLAVREGPRPTLLERSLECVHFDALTLFDEKPWARGILVTMQQADKVEVDVGVVAGRTHRKLVSGSTAEVVQVSDQCHVCSFVRSAGDALNSIDDRGENVHIDSASDELRWCSAHSAPRAVPDEKSA
ncbi:hypothetical protein MTOK_57690 [Mycolicibacterium tokaiense]|nr:hypothetical protein MTOK_57690 [Mycolicibacterium tokaiense]